MASSSAETPEKQAPPPSSASSPKRDAEGESLIIDETEEVLRQGISPGSGSSGSGRGSAARRRSLPGPRPSSPSLTISVTSPGSRIPASP